MRTRDSRQVRTYWPGVSGMCWFVIEANFCIFFEHFAGRSEGGVRGINERLEGGRLGGEGGELVVGVGLALREVVGADLLDEPKTR